MIKGGQIGQNPDMIVGDPDGGSGLFSFVSHPFKSLFNSNNTQNPDVNVGNSNVNDGGMFSFITTP